MPEDLLSSIDREAISTLAILARRFLGSTPSGSIMSIGDYLLLEETRTAESAVVLSDLATALAKSPATVSRSIRPLEVRGWLARTERRIGSKKFVLVHPTREGVQAADHEYRVRAKALVTATAQLSEAQLLALLGSLEKLR
jgi:DNA-binding MarR family transcriptional regulator